MVKYGEYGEPIVDYNPYQDTSYGSYKTIHDYLIEPERIGYLKSVIRAKKQVIQMLNVELHELEKELADETTKFNSSKNR